MKKWMSEWSQIILKIWENSTFFKQNIKYNIKYFYFDTGIRNAWRLCHNNPQPTKQDCRTSLRSIKRLCSVIWCAVQSSNEIK